MKFKWSWKPVIAKPKNPTDREEFGAVDSLYDKYKHVICISPEKSGGFWVNREPLNQWCLDNECHWTADRALPDCTGNRWRSNGVAGGDYFFVATNSNEAAMLAKLVWQ